jgi:hypothetical protein
MCVCVLTGESTLERGIGSSFFKPTRHTAKSLSRHSNREIGISATSKLISRQLGISGEGMLQRLFARQS